mmetsp:Transcript_37113/g.80817  ORF Transcript_37113/g.80817 Transcript_37113/m.80817 type:complete len:234 (+) Transcript_37113:239-940(+)
MHLLLGEELLGGAVEGGAVRHEDDDARRRRAPGQPGARVLQPLRHAVPRVVPRPVRVHALHPHLQPGPVVGERHAGVDRVEAELGELLLRRLLRLDLVLGLRLQRRVRDALVRHHAHLDARALRQLRHELHHLAVAAAAAEDAGEGGDAGLHGLRLLHEEGDVHLARAAAGGPEREHLLGGRVHLRLLLAQLLGDLRAQLHRDLRVRVQLHRECVCDVEVPRGSEDGLVGARL